MQNHNVLPQTLYFTLLSKVQRAPLNGLHSRKLPYVLCLFEFIFTWELLINKCCTTIPDNSKAAHLTSSLKCKGDQNKIMLLQEEKLHLAENYHFDIYLSAMYSVIYEINWLHVKRFPYEFTYRDAVCILSKYLSICTGVYSLFAVCHGKELTLLC